MKTADIPAGESRNLALELIELEPDFNPRSGRDPKRFEALVDSVRREGVIQPVLVRPEGEGFVLIAGEGRYLAAREAGLIEIPALVRQDGEFSERLVLALCENLIREDLDPVEEARGFKALIDAGLTKKGVAERLGVTQKLVTERLSILELPETVQEQVADGTVPPGAIRALVTLAKIHGQLPEVACALVGMQPEQSWLEPLTWSEVAEDPVESVLPALRPGDEVIVSDAYDASERYPLSRFTLSEKASKQINEICELMSLSDPDQLRVHFDRGAVEQALALGAAYPTKDGWRHLIVGQDVADQLACDFIALVLKNQTATRVEPSSGGEGAPSPAASEEEVKAQRKAERETQTEVRRAAHAHNTALGAEVVKTLARLRVDADLLKVLTAIEVGADLPAIAMRGARYGFPDWVAETPQSSGKVKVTYVDRYEAGAKAAEFIGRAKTPAEIAGRLFCLIAMARYADEDAVANSSRSFYELRRARDLPYGEDAVALVERICAERLPKHLVGVKGQGRS